MAVAPGQSERIASNRPLQRCSAATAGGSVDGQSSGRNTSGVQPDVTAGGLVSLRQCSCRPRHGKITAASGNNTRVPCAKRDVLPTRTAHNQRVSDRAENCGERVAVGVARCSEQRNAARLGQGGDEEDVRNDGVSSRSCSSTQKVEGFNVVAV